MVRLVYTHRQDRLEESQLARGLGSPIKIIPLVWCVFLKADGTPIGAAVRAPRKDPRFAITHNNLCAAEHSPVVAR